eukprot:366533-Chlamydomonas_euryale.AAC.1
MLSTSALHREPPQQCSVHQPPRPSARTLWAPGRRGLAGHAAAHGAVHTQASGRGAGRMGAPAVRAHGAGPAVRRRAARQVCGRAEGCGGRTGRSAVGCAWCGSTWCGCVW